MRAWLERHWYQRSIGWFLLLPLSGIYRGVIALRHWAYRKGICSSQRLAVPVVVVGNISVGGAGKTPLVIALARLILSAGLRPGIISRGYNGSGPFPRAVQTDSDPGQCGDEPVMMAHHLQIPIWVGPNRYHTAKALLAQEACDVLLLDDGLQHYSLQRDIEIAVVDARRGFGNQACLPAGPLREPISRLRNCDFVIHHGDPTAPFSMALNGNTLVNLASPELTESITKWRNRKVWAVAGIGHPERFFDTLRRAGLQVQAKALPDHHCFQANDLQFPSNDPILMTEKDAVKCHMLSTPQMWYLPVEAELSAAFETQFIHQLKSLLPRG